MSNLDLRRAAVILLSLPESEAALLLSKLDTSQVELVAAEMASVARLGGLEQEQTLRMFAEAKLDQVSIETRGLAVTQRILAQACGDRAPTILANVRLRLELTTFDFLEHVDDQAILAILEQELPQTITLVMAHLPVRRAAQLLQRLPEDRQGTIIRRIAALKPASAEVLCAVQQALRDQLAAVAKGDQAATSPPPTLSSLPNSFDGSNQRTVHWHLPLAS